MEIRQARKSSVSIMPVFFCGANGGTHTGGEAEAAGRRQDTDGQRRRGGQERGGNPTGKGGRKQGDANIRPGEEWKADQ